MRVFQTMTGSKPFYLDPCIRVADLGASEAPWTAQVPDSVPGIVTLDATKLVVPHLFVGHLAQTIAAVVDEVLSSCEWPTWTEETYTINHEVNRVADAFVRIEARSLQRHLQPGAR